MSKAMASALRRHSPACSINLMACSHAPGTIETGCFKPLFHGFVRPGADIEPGIKREIHPRVTQRKHGAAVMPALPVRYEPVREPLS